MDDLHYVNQVMLPSESYISIKIGDDSRRLMKDGSKVEDGRVTKEIIAAFHGLTGSRWIGQVTQKILYIRLYQVFVLCNRRSSKCSD